VRLLDQPKEIRVTFAFWQVFRSLGFESEDIYVGIVDGRMLVQVRQGTEKYSVSMGNTTMPPDDFEDAWGRLAEVLSEQPMADLKANYEEWVTEERWEAVIGSLVVAGATIPAHRRLHMN